MESINVYVDGACINNGSPDAKAGYGVYFGDNDNRNESNVVQGKQTNNTGELTGFIRALEILEDDIKNNKTIHIYSDSEYVIKCMKSYCDKLVKNNWKTSTDKTPPNVELLKKAYALYKNKSNIKLHHVKAHTDGEDEHSIGNREADRLANLSLGVKACPYNKKYIQINYENKDSAKLLGAKWDMKEKKWYYTDDLSDENKQAINLLELAYLKSKELVPILEEPTYTTPDKGEKVYIKIPFKNKDIAKKLGARWDATLKSWYYLSSLSETNISKLKQLEG